MLPHRHITGAPSSMPDQQAGMGTTSQQEAHPQCPDSPGCASSCPAEGQEQEIHDACQHLVTAANPHTNHLVTVPLTLAAIADDVRMRPRLNSGTAALEKLAALREQLRQSLALDDGCILKSTVSIGFLSAGTSRKDHSLGRPRYRPMFLAMIVFMISLVPPKRRGCPRTDGRSGIRS